MTGKRDRRAEPFGTMVVMGESTVAGGPFLTRPEQRWADVLADLIARCQAAALTYHNKGIGANTISPRSPGYEASAKPSALERYREDVIALNPDLFLLCYGLNDMRAGMDPERFREDMRAIIVDVTAACAPFTLLTTAYHMTAWRSYAPFDRGSPALTERYNAVIRELAEEQDCVVADVWDAQGRADWLMHADGVHPNAVGNLVIAHRVFEALAQSCSCLSRQAHLYAVGTEWTRFTTAERAAAGDPFDPWWQTPGRS